MNENEEFQGSLRRKSCECDKCGQTSKLEQKANLLQISFQTKYEKKKLEMQKMFSQQEREKSVSLDTSSFFLKKKIVSKIFVRTNTKGEKSHKKREPDNFVKHEKCNIYIL